MALPEADCKWTLDMRRSARCVVSHKMAFGSRSMEYPALVLYIRLGSGTIVDTSEPRSLHYLLLGCVCPLFLAYQYYRYDGTSVSRCLLGLLFWSSYVRYRLLEASP